MVLFLTSQNLDTNQMTFARVARQHSTLNSFHCVVPNLAELGTSFPRYQFYTTPSFVSLARIRSRFFGLWRRRRLICIGGQIKEQQVLHVGRFISGSSFSNHRWRTTSVDWCRRWQSNAMTMGSGTVSTHVPMGLVSKERQNERPTCRKSDKSKTASKLMSDTYRLLPIWAEICVHND